MCSRNIRWKANATTLWELLNWYTSALHEAAQQRPFGSKRLVYATPEFLYHYCRYLKPPIRVEAVEPRHTVVIGHARQVLDGARVLQSGSGGY